MKKFASKAGRFSLPVIITAGSLLAAGPLSAMADDSYPGGFPGPPVGTAADANALPAPAPEHSTYGSPTDLKQFTGTITTRLGTNFYQLNYDQGGQLRVVFDDDSDHALSTGQQVSITGYRDGDLLVAYHASATPVRQDQSWQTPPAQPAPAVPTQGVTVQGTVTRTFLSRQFEMRDNEGRLVTVDASGADFSDVAVGDSVQVRGLWTADGLSAKSVHEVTPQPAANMPGAQTGEPGMGQGGGPYTSNVSFPGTVVDIPSTGKLTVRGDDGHLYTVSTGNVAPAQIGDHIRLSGGTRNDGTVFIDQITPADGAPTAPTAPAAGQAPAGDPVNFPGTVDSVQPNSHSIYVRGGNGRIYLVKYYDVSGFSVGDTVRVVGSTQDGIVTATNVTRQ